MPASLEPHSVCVCVCVDNLHPDSVSWHLIAWAGDARGTDTGPRHMITAWAYSVGTIASLSTWLDPSRGHQDSLWSIEQWWDDTIPPFSSGASRGSSGQESVVGVIGLIQCNRKAVWSINTLETPAPPHRQLLVSNICLFFRVRSTLNI